MHRNLWAALAVGAVLGWGAARLPVGPTPAHAAGPVTGQEGLEVSVMRLGDTLSQMVVVDRFKKSAAVYHIDSATGKLAFKSARNIYWDLEMMAHNSENPLPDQIRQMMQQR